MSPLWNDATRNFFSPRCDQIEFSRLNILAGASLDILDVGASRRRRSKENLMTDDVGRQ